MEEAVLLYKGSDPKKFDPDPKLFENLDTDSDPKQIVSNL
jgi:hypothetical protein